MKVIIEAISTPDVWHLSGSVRLRIYANQSFITAGGQFVPQSNPGTSQAAYLEVICTVVGSVLTIPSFEIDSTVDGVDHTGATYNAYLVAGGKRVPFLEYFPVNTLEAGDPSTTWGEIILLRNAFNPQTISDSLIRQLLANIQLAVGELNKASETNLGVTALTVDPIDPAFPIAVSANDPDYLALTANVTIHQSSEYASLAAAVTAIGAMPGTLKIVAADFPSGASVVVPSTLVLDWGDVGTLLLTTGHTVTIRSDMSLYPRRQLFGNALAGQGTISVAGSNAAPVFYPEWWGAKGDNATDCTPAVRAIMVMLRTALKSGAISFLDAKYLFTSGPEDVAASNAVVALPKVNNNEKMISVEFFGPTPAPNPWSTDSGTILRFTNVPVNACCIGVKNDQGNGAANANIAAHNISSYINPVFRNLTVRQIANPPGSGVDVSRTYNPQLTNFRTDTDDFGTGGLNPNLIAGVPDVLCTEPTTATSWALKLPIDFIPSNAALDNVTLLGHYNSLRVGELPHGRNITIAGSKVGFGIEGATWPSNFQNVVMVSTTRKIQAIGTTPDLVGIPGANTNAIVYIDPIKVEDDPLMPWAMTVYDIDDPLNLLTGRINIFGGLSFTQSQPRLNQGANPSLQIGNLALWNGMRVDQWKTFVPVIGAQSGAFTSVTATGHWRQLDVAAVAVEIFIQITTNGTAAGHVTATLPVTVAVDQAQALYGRAGAGSTVSLGVIVASGTDDIIITKYDGTYPGGDGINLHISGIVRLTP